MAILALATSGNEGEVGLQAPDGRRSICVLPPRRGRDVALRIHELLDAAELEVEDLTAIAADVGPGSFTGVRVGVTAARTLGFALEIPVVGICSLEILAQAAPPEATVLALRDAGRDTLYHACYGPIGEGGRVCLTEPARGREEDVRRALRTAEGRGRACVVGEDARTLAERHGLEREALDLRAGANALLDLAAKRLQDGRDEDAAPVVPLYLQASTPERRLAGEED